MKKVMVLFCFCTSLSGMQIEALRARVSAGEDLTPVLCNPGTYTAERGRVLVQLLSRERWITNPTGDHQVREEAAYNKLLAGTTALVEGGKMDPHMQDGLFMRKDMNTVLNR